MDVIWPLKPKQGWHERKKKTDGEIEKGQNAVNLRDNEIHVQT